MLKVGILLVALFTSFTVEAETLRGKLEFRGPAVFIKTEKYATLEISVQKPELLDQLRRLNDGDLLIGVATVESAKHLAHLESISFVGLKDLLGFWRTERWEVFEFQNFNRLILYKFTKIPKNLTPSVMPKELKYTLAPEQGRRWSIFMSDDQNIHIGSLELEEKRVSLTIINPNTGLPTENISLLPVSVR